MDEYNPIVVPFAFRPFESFNKKQAEEFFNWYVAQSMTRIDCLCDYIRSTGEKAFSCDYTPESLIDLWAWFEPEITMVQMKEEDYQAELEAAPEWVRASISKEEFSYKTLGLITDISFYFAETFLRNNPSIRWGYFTKPKNEVSVNKPVLMGFRCSIKLDPRQIVDVCARRSYRQRDKNQLFDAYQVWLEDIEPQETE